MRNQDKEDKQDTNEDGFLVFESDIKSGHTFVFGSTGNGKTIFLSDNFETDKENHDE